ncbi:MAG: hypothetical protein OEW47_12120 [Thermoleophilia bacterium]|nr:hypothetical protein [Thermoleophilia bacterium]
MKPTHAALAVVAVVATVAAVVFGALYFTKDSESESAAAEQCGDRIFGHISSLARKGDQYEMRFDPAWFTSGVTANTAAAEDGVVEPGEPVPNDNYRIEEGHRLLTYLVPSEAHVTVLTNDGTGIMSTPIGVPELAQLLNGEKPVELFEPLDTGAWIRIDIDTVCALDQQYQP